jgi:hypothetical protein
VNKRMLERCALALILGLTLAAGAMAGPAPEPQQSMPAKQATIYTYVSFFGVPRANWAEYEKNEEKTRKTYESLIADGTIISWGSGALEVHEGLTAPTHVAWMSSTSVSGILKASAAFRGPSAPSAEINYTMHSDALIMSSNYGGNPSAAPSKYLLVQEWMPKAGQNDQFMSLFTKHRKPDLDALVADGTISSYSLNTELIHTGPPGSVTLTIEFPSAEAMDKFYSQIESMQEKNPLFGTAFVAATEGSEHRDHLLRILESGHK